MTAKTTAEAEAQARFFLQTIGKRTYDLKLAMDYGGEQGLTTASLNANALAFLRAVERNSGTKPVIYTSASKARDVWSQELASQYRLWVANYYVPLPEANGKWPGWVGFQYTNRGSVDGISGNVDRDRFNQLRAARNLCAHARAASYGQQAHLLHHPKGRYALGNRRAL